jgi:hypothetical protein
MSPTKTKNDLDTNGITIHDHHEHIYNMNIYFKVVEVQIQALENIPKLGRDSYYQQLPP